MATNHTSLALENPVHQKMKGYPAKQIRGGIILNRIRIIIITIDFKCYIISVLPPPNHKRILHPMAQYLHHVAQYQTHRLPF